jgi:molybdenum cofactor synthesis domain-containing protein
LLEGTVLDRNANYLAGRLNERGYRVTSIQVLDDVEAQIAAAVQQALTQRPGIIITTGGLGPGHNDVTRESIARAIGRSLNLDAAAREMLATSYRRLFAKGMVEDAELHEDRLRMAEVPEGGTCFENPIGTAPAVRLEVDDTILFLLPGTPVEMQRLFQLYIDPALAAEGQGNIKKARHIVYPGADESAISRLLRDLNRRHPGIHSRARADGSGEDAVLRITLFTEHADESQLDALLERAEADLRSRLGLEVQGGVESD